MNPLIFITKFGESRFFNPGTRSTPPWHRLDRVAQTTRILQGIRVTGPRNGPARVPRFSGTPRPRPAILEDFAGRSEGIISHFKTIFLGHPGQNAGSQVLKWLVMR